MPFDIAANWPFTEQHLTDTVNDIDNVWGYLAELDYSPGEGIDSTVIEVAIVGDTVRILPNMPRGGETAADQPQTEKSEFIKLPFFPVAKTLTAADIQDWVKKSQRDRKPKSMAESLAEYLTKRRMNHDLTLEFIRMGALKGLLKDGTGGTLLNLFTAFDVTKKQVNFELDVATTNVKAKCAEVHSHIRQNLRGEVMTGVEVMVSKDFFDDLTSHPNVEKFYVNWQAASEQANPLYSMYGRTFLFGGILFREYDAAVTLYDGTASAMVDDGLGHAFPVGTMSAYETYFGPADDIRFANEDGYDIYVSQEPLKHGTGIEIKDSSAPLSVFRKPACLVECLKN